MSNLIQDLLAFSRVSSKTDQTEPVSLTKVVESALTDLELNIQESGAIITMDVLPVIEGDVLQLGKLFQNLISNAIKFRKTIWIRKLILQVKVSPKKILHI